MRLKDVRAWNGDVRGIYMPYSRLSDLPEKIQRLPQHAQEIYRKAFNSAWQQYADPSKRRLANTREVTAHRVA